MKRVHVHIALYIVLFSCYTHANVLIDQFHRYPERTSGYPSTEGTYSDPTEIDQLFQMAMQSVITLATE